MVLSEAWILMNKTEMNENNGMMGEKTGGKVGVVD